MAREDQAILSMSTNERLEFVSSSTKQNQTWYAVEFRVMEKGEAGPREGTQYDLTQGCPRCGTGSRQLSPLLLRKSDLPANRPIARTLDHDLLLRDDLANSILEATGTGAHLWPVLERKTRQPLPWWQLYPQHTFPKADEATRGLVTKRQCAECHRDGHFSDRNHPDLSFVYRLPKVQVETLPHVCATWECFGWSTLIEDPPDAVPRRVLRFARPCIIVSETVGRVLREASTKVVLYPVRFIT